MRVATKSRNSAWVSFDGRNRREIKIGNRSVWFILQYIVTVIYRITYLCDILLIRLCDISRERTIKVRTRFPARIYVLYCKLLA